MHSGSRGENLAAGLPPGTRTANPTAIRFPQKSYTIHFPIEQRDRAEHRL